MTFGSQPTSARTSPLLVDFREECEALTEPDAARMTMYPADWIRVATPEYWKDADAGMLSHAINVLHRLLHLRGDADGTAFQSRAWGITVRRGALEEYIIAERNQGEWVSGSRTFSDDEVITVGTMYKSDPVKS